MHGLSVIKLYNDIKGTYPDIDTWEAESIEHELPNIDNAGDIISAMSMCATSRKPWEDLLVFQKVCLVLNGRYVFFDVKQNLFIREIAYAAQILKAIYPNELFNDEVAQYIATEALEEGFVILPDVISFAQRFIPNYYVSNVQEDIQKACLDEATNYSTMMSSEMSGVSEVEVGV